MPAILGKLLAWIVQLVGPFLVEKIGGAIKGAMTKLRRNKEIDDEAKRSVEKLKDAKTGKEVDDAADDVLGGV